MSFVDKQALRVSHLQDYQGLKNKQRLGFFSVPITTAVGDDGPFKSKLHPRNQMGKPETKPRNFQTSPTRSGQLTKSFLGPLNSLATTGNKDEFIQQPKRLIKKLIPHEKEFIPQANYKLLNSTSYLHVEENNPEKEPKRNRDADGKVRSQPRQLQTNIQSRVISDYFKPIKYVSDPINRAHDIEWQRQKSAKAKEAEAPFNPNKFNTDLFNTNREVFNDHEIKRTRYFRETKFNIGKHQQKWKDTNANRRGLYGYFTPFPEYIQNPPREVKRRDRSGEKDVFKAMNSTTLALPFSSVAQHPTNLRRSLNHSFSHRPF